MKAIKILNAKTAIYAPYGTREDASQDPVEAALLAVNGKATAHTFTTYNALVDASQWAEKQLNTLGIPKGQRTGARLMALSGEAVPNAYKYSRQGTYILMERRAAGWYLTEVEASTIYKEGGFRRVALTQAQDTVAVQKFRSAYAIIPA
jgi:hypothetical protein